MSENFKCALCQIVDKAQFALDHPDNSTKEALQEIYKLASVALIRGMLGHNEASTCHLKEKT